MIASTTTTNTMPGKRGLSVLDATIQHTYTHTHRERERERERESREQNDQRTGAHSRHRHPSRALEASLSTIALEWLLCQLCGSRINGQCTVNKRILMEQGLCSSGPHVKLLQQTGKGIHLLREAKDLPLEGVVVAACKRFWRMMLSPSLVLKLAKFTKSAESRHGVWTSVC